MSDEDIPALSVVQGRPSDEELAKQYREKLGPMLEEVAAVLNDADRHHFDVRFNLTRDGFGRWVVPPIGIVRVL